MNDSTLKCYEKFYRERCHQLKDWGCDNSELNNYENFNDMMSKDVFKDLMNLKQRRKNKRYRTAREFKKLFLLNQVIPNATIVFITITLNDEILSKKEDTYTRYIHKWLKKHFLISILNKDFGKKTEREHYHALGITIEPIERLKDKNGVSKRSKTGLAMYELEKKDFAEICKAKEQQFEPTINEVELDKNDIRKTVNYLLKLNNHSNKVTTRNRVRIIKSPLMSLYELRTNR